MKLYARTLACLAVVIALAPIARSDDWKWDPKQKKKAKVGYKSNDEGETFQKQASTVSVEKQVVKKEDKEEKVTFKLVKEVKAVDKDKASEEVLKVEKFSRKETDEEEDKSLEGQTVVITSKDGKKTATYPDDKDGKVSDGAKAFITQYYAKNKKDEEEKKNEEDDDEGFQKFFPAKPVGDGEEWTCDAAAIAKEMFGSADNIDIEKSTVKGKLSKVKVDKGAHHGLIEVTIHLKLKSLPGMPAEMEVEWTEGGSFDMTVVIDGSLEHDKREAASFVVEGGLAGKAKFQAQGQAASLKMNVKNKITMKTAPVE